MSNPNESSCLQTFGGGQKPSQQELDAHAHSRLGRLQTTYQRLVDATDENLIKYRASLISRDRYLFMQGALERAFRRYYIIEERM
jgi:hypothetical protein